MHVGGRGVGHPRVLTEVKPKKSNFSMINKTRMKNRTMYNTSHTAQPPLRGEAAGLKTPAASHLPLPYLGYVPWVKFKLFVHYSFIIVHHAKERCPGEVPGGPRGRIQIARGPSEKPIPGQKWDGTHRRSSFTKRNIFTTIRCLCKSCVLTWGIIHLE